jgi:subtilisin-like proprotein convertase family protein
LKKHLLTLSKAAAFVAILMLGTEASAQTEQEVQKIIAHYDLEYLKELQLQFAKKQKIEKAKALEAAKINNWQEFRTNSNGSVDELMKLAADGTPLYYSTNNLAAAISTRASFLQSLYNLKGQGMTARVWDGGKVRASHQEFGNRVSVIDATAGSSGNSGHATHVTGTIVASGVVPNAKGMAPMASARTFNWSNDLSEAANEAQMGMLLSNHSYGVPSYNVPGWYIGAYTDDSRAWDQLLYSAPYYLMVVSAGNNGLDANTEAMTPGYDKLTGNKVSKNNLVVANAQDATISSTGALQFVSINSGSSQGPADDFRIKPDITGNGSNVYSTFEANDADYGSISGTSMSAPNVTGTLLLLQQYYNQVNQTFMKAATLKALACHTADDAGNPGPDAKFGWGLLNGLKAAQAITNNGMTSIISEETISQGQTKTYTVVSDGVNPLQATIAWTDVPGNLTNGSLNNPTPALVNDLDIRITQNGTTYYPWRLTGNAGANAVRNGDNNVDNIENVDIDTASGTYTITVTHKGNLVNGPQDFSLVVTGANSQFSIAPMSGPQIVCSTDSAQYNFQYSSITFESTNLQVTGLPAGATATLSQTSLLLPDPFTVTISNLQNVAPGEYNITLTGSNSSESESKTMVLTVLSSNFDNISLNSPANNAGGIATTVNLNWTEMFNAESYKVQVSTSADFSNLIANETVTTTSYMLKGLNQATVYYWRVLPQNRCGAATANTVFQFETGIQTCGNIFNATDYTRASISENQGVVAEIPVTVTGGMIVADLTIDLNITHSYIEDLSIYLEGPQSLGYPVIALFEEPCGSQDNIVATISDAGTPFVCATNPAISGTVLPKEPLSTFANLPANGVWTLYVVDNYQGDGGAVNSFSLNFCNVVSATAGVNEALKSMVKVYPNPANSQVTVELSDSASGPTTVTLYDIQGRRISSLETSAVSEIVPLDGLQEGVYILKIDNDQYSTSKKIVVKR